MIAETQIPEWLKVEAYSNYLIFALGICGGLLVAAAKHFFRKIPHIEVSRVRHAALVSYSAEIAHRLDITYGDRRVAQLFGSTLTFRNRGTEPIQNINLTITIDGKEAKSSFIEFHTLEDGDPKRRPDVATKLKQDGPTLFTAEVFIPYLNPFGDHKDTVAINMFCDAELTITRVSGAGSGWSSRFIDRHALWEDLALDLTPTGATPLLNAAVAVTKYLARRV
ncbi:MAG: hypothetical protein OJI67_08045 [Prosthecobacter sp.]|nr:hypothetical protein [Prosthecobacter sp.]